MNIRLLLITTLIITLVCMSCLTCEVQNVKASGIIYIEADGSIDGTDNIHREGNLYTFIDNIYGEIVIQKNHITVDGNGCRVQGSGSGKGFDLSVINNVTIKNVVVDNFSKGIFLHASSGNTISRNDIVNNSNGIEIYYSSSDNVISRNHIVNNSCVGIKLVSSSSNNIVYGNTIANNNEWGVYMSSAPNNTFCQNMIDKNRYNFGVFGGRNLRDYIHSIDDSNLVNGKPVYYIVNKKNLTMSHTTHPQIGYLALINCTNVKVENLTITEENDRGIHLAYTNNSTIINNNIKKDFVGVMLLSSSSNTISGNHIASQNTGILLIESCNNILIGNKIVNNSYHGIDSSRSSNNSISGNEIRDNGCGIWLILSFGYHISKNNVTNNQEGLHCYSSPNNIIYRNDISANKNGISFGNASNNKVFENNIFANKIGIGLWGGNVSVYHNNFVNNTSHVGLLSSTSTLDNGLEGNYWSNYTDVDLNHDGIGDSPHVIMGPSCVIPRPRAEDRHPLMGMFHSFNTSLDYHIEVITNSTIVDFECEESSNTVKAWVSDSSTIQNFGFCRVRIPHDLMSEPYKVTVNDTDPLYWNYTLYDDGQNRWIYFSYKHSTLEIVIIPEFQPFTILPLLIMATLLAVMIYKRVKLREQEP